MAERVDSLVGARSLTKPLISTFHSFCVRMLRRDIEALQIGGKGYRKDFVIYDETDQQSVVKAAMRRLGIDDKQLTPRNVLGRISWAKNHMLDPQEVYLDSGDPKTERIAHIYEIYRQELAKANALDFDDLLLYAVKLLKASSRGAREVQPPLSPHPGRRVPGHQPSAVRADAHAGRQRAQRLRRRRRGPEHLLVARRRHPQHPGVRAGLSRGHASFAWSRTTARRRTFLQAASAVVANNVKRKGKNLWTDRQGGAKIGYYEAPDGENEALFAADYIAKYLRAGAGEDGETPRAAVLYRTNSQSRLFEEAMRRYQIKYHVVGGFSFYERAEIKDMISYLKVIANPDDSIACSASSIRRRAASARRRWRPSSGSRWRRARRCGARSARPFTRQLLPPRSLAALKSFRAHRRCACHVSGDVSRACGGDVAAREAKSPSDAEKTCSIRWTSRLMERSSRRICSRSVGSRGSTRDPRLRRACAPLE